MKITGVLIGDKNNRHDVVLNNKYLYFVTNYNGKISHNDFIPITEYTYHAGDLNNIVIEQNNIVTGYKMELNRWQRFKLWQYFIIKNLKVTLTIKFFSFFSIKIKSH